METLILICLVLVIILLLENNITVRQWSKRNKEPQEITTVELPDIMGKPGTTFGKSLPKATTENPTEVQLDEADIFDIEIDENEVGIQIPQEELDEVFSKGPDLREEEEEWNEQGISGGDSGFATGVTFEELSTVGMLLQQDVLEPSQEKTAVGIVQKIQGTELFNLLENSMEGASKRMAELLDRSLSAQTDSGSSAMRKKDLDDFNIGDFV
jgi:hypothetical protein